MPLKLTPAFEQWFKGSKVVDAEGAPLLLYHGTRSDIKQIDMSASARLPGFWMTPDPKLASTYAAEGVVNASRYREGANVMAVFAKIERPRIYHPKKESLQHVWVDYMDGDFDGFVELDNEGAVYAMAVKSSSQVKSATGNNGDFDVANPDIRFSQPDQDGSPLIASTQSRRVDSPQKPNSPAFMSGLQRAIKSAPDQLNNQSAAQWQLWLSANAAKLGVKKDEIEWSAIYDYLVLRGTQKVSREEIIDYLTENGVKLEEMILGELPNKWYWREATGSLTFAVHGPFDTKADATLMATGQMEYVNDVWVPLDLEKAVYDRKPAGPGVGRSYSQYGHYVVPGGSNYREVLLKLPQKPDRTVFKVVNSKAGVQLKTFESEDSAKDFIANWGGPGVLSIIKKDDVDAEKTFRSGHWNDVPNILAHLRVDDRIGTDGKSVLMIHEIQSDWAQEGRQEGFAGVLDKYAPGMPDWSAKHDSTRNSWTVTAPDGKLANFGDSEAGLDEQSAIKQAAQILSNAFGGVPRAPFVTTTQAWVSLAIKRAIMMAVEGNYDRVAFITGEQASGLYNITKQVSRIEYEIAENPQESRDDQGDQIDQDSQGTRFKLVAFDHEDERVIEEDDIDIERIKALMGKDIAAKITAGIGESTNPKIWSVFEGDEKLFESEIEETARAFTSLVDGNPVVRSHTDSYRDLRVLSGLNLEVGGEGMKAFYDKLVPQIANDVLKKLGGGKVGELALTNELTNELTSKSANESVSKSAQKMQPGFDITPVMRETVLEGVILFSQPDTDTLPLFTSIPEGLEARGYTRLPRGDDRRFKGFGTWEKAGVRVALSGNLLMIDNRGDVMVYFGDGAMTIEALITDPDQRRQGRGRAALEDLTELADTLGRPLYLEPVPLEKNSSVDINALKGFYASMGFAAADARGKVMVRMPSPAPAPTQTPATSLGDLTVKNLDSTQSPAFDAWFARSVVSTAEGSPLRVFHATRADFTVFDPLRSSPSNRFGPGLYFTSDPKTLDVYADSKLPSEGGQLMPVYLQIERPQRDGALTKEQVNAFFAALQVKQFPNGYDATADHERIKARALDDLPSAFNTLLSGQLSFIATTDWLRGMDAIGVDGIIREVFGHPEYVAFKPQQVKSAIGNNGNYSALAPDLRFSFSGPAAATANLASLADAKARTLAGELAETVRQETGWHQGLDALWRFEISDDQARVLPAIRSMASGGYPAGPMTSATYRANRDGTYDLTLNPAVPMKTTDFAVFVSVQREVVEAVLPDEISRLVFQGQGEPDFIGNLEDAQRVQGAFAFEGFDALPLDQVFDHPSLFSAYPALREVMVRVNPKLGSDASVGIMADGTRVIQLGRSRQRIALIHEIQHIVQDIEGFSPGSTSALAYEARKASDNSNSSSNGNSDGNNHLQSLKRANPQLTAALDRLEQPQLSPQERSVATEEVQAQMRSAVRKIGHMAYLSTAGEVEARNTETRLNMDTEARRRTPPSATADSLGSDTESADVSSVVPANTSSTSNIFKRYKGGPDRALKPTAKTDETDESDQSQIDRVKAAVARLLGGSSEHLEMGLGKVVVFTSKSLPQDWNPLNAGDTRLSRFNAPGSLDNQGRGEGDESVESVESVEGVGNGDYARLMTAAQHSTAQAFYDPRTRTTALIADRIPRGLEASVFLHEITHKHGRTTLGRAAWTGLVDQIKAWSDHAPGSSERSIYQSAVTRAVRSGTKGLVFDEELFAYAVESAVRQGIKPSADAAPHSSERWLADVISSIERVSQKLTGQRLETLTTQDVVDFSYALAQMETPQHAQAIQNAFEQHLARRPVPSQEQEQEQEQEKEQAPMELSGVFESQTVDQQSECGPVWFSPLRRAIASSVMKSAPAKDWASFIQGLTKKGVKVDEIEWSGVLEWLALQDGKLPLSQLVEFMDAHGVQLQEILLGGPETTEDGRLCNPTHFESYVMLGAKDYREIVLMLATDDHRKVDPTTAARFAIVRHQKDQGNPESQGPKEFFTLNKDGRPHQPPTQFQTALDAEASIRRRSEVMTPSFRSVHWPVSNVLAHVRFNERAGVDGKRVLFIEEIQSDWAQQGKKRGFVSTDTTIDGKTASQWQSLSQDLFGKWSGENDAACLQWKQAALNAKTLREKYVVMGLTDVVEIPSAPFVTTTDAWLNLSIKRMIRYAAENNFDSIAFISGEQSVQRYENMREKADQVEVHADGHGGYLLKASKNGRNAVMDVGRDRRPLHYSSANLAKEIGKPLATRAIKDLDAGVQANYTGLNIYLGGEGMKTFYDNVVPTTTKRLIQKLGGNGITQQELIIRGETFQQTAFDITPAMQAMALEGMPLFSLVEPVADVSLCGLA